MVVQLAHEMAEAFDVAAVVANEVLHIFLLLLVSMVPTCAPSQLSEIDGVIEQNLTQIDEFQVLLGTVWQQGSIQK